MSTIFSYCSSGTSSGVGHGTNANIVKTSKLANPSENVLPVVEAPQTMVKSAKKPTAKRSPRGNNRK